LLPRDAKAAQVAQVQLVLELLALPFLGLAEQASCASRFRAFSLEMSHKEVE
jgi:hypothetical protein